MAKDASKQVKPKKSTEGLLSRVKKTEKASAPLAAETKKSVKRKQDETKAALEDAALEVEPASSSKKTKLVSVESTVKEKKGKKGTIVEKTVVKETMTSKPKEKQLPFPKKDKHAAPTKITNSRKKQKDPRPLAPTLDDSDEDEDEDEDEEVEALKPLKAKTKEVKKGGKKVQEPQESEDEGENSSQGEDNMHLHGFSTDEDSSDDEMDQDESGFDVGKLPTVAKDDATVKARLEKAKKNPTEDRGVLFLGRVPHGFYEDQMKGYFSQFGDVTRVRLSRNKKTGKSKHYGFIEFESSSVAKIVAETMDNYLLNGHLLQCKIIPKDEVHPQLWVGANRKWRPVPSGRLAMAKHNKPRDKGEQEVVARRLVKRENQRKRKLEQMGISYDFDMVSYKKSKASETPAAA